jgi:hypothetical protein
MEEGTQFMSDPFTAAGFNVNEQADWDRLAMMTAGQGETVTASKRSYRRWTLDCGVELWAHIRGAGEVVGLSPHFDGRARLATRVVKLLPRHTPFDIAVGCWTTQAAPIIEADGEEPVDGNFPFVFDTPDGATYHTLTLPQPTTIQLTAFAFEVSAYPNEAAFATAQHNSETPLAAQAFIPTAAITSRNQAPPASALIAGVIKQSETLENRVGGKTFEWARIETHGGEIDVLASPATVQGDIVTGGILHGSFWLSGRILEGTHRESGLLNRLRDRIKGPAQ